MKPCPFRSDITTPNYNRITDGSTRPSELQCARPCIAAQQARECLVPDLSLIWEFSVSDRKYRQHGYQDSGTEREKSIQSPRPVKKDTFGPRPVQMPGTHTVSRCGQCGTLLTMLAEPLGQCPKCAFELHSCKQCTYFDPSRRFECMQPVAERVAKKDARNDCPSFSISVRVEKQTSTGAAAKPNSARKAFDDLFKD